MAWTYSDYSTYPSGPARLARLQLHIKEVSDEINAERSINGRSIAFASLSAMWHELKDEEKRTGGQTLRAAGRARCVQSPPRSSPEGVRLR